MFRSINVGKIMYPIIKMLKNTTLCFNLSNSDIC